MHERKTTCPYPKKTQPDPICDNRASRIRLVQTFKICSRERPSKISRLTNFYTNHDEVRRHATNTYFAQRLLTMSINYRHVLPVRLLIMYPFIVLVLFEESSVSRVSTVGYIL